MTAESTARGETRKDERTAARFRWSVTIPLVALLVLGVAFPGGALAASPQPRTVSAATNCNGNSTCDLDSTLNNIQYFLIGVGVLIGGIMFALFGIQHMAGAVEEMPPEKRLQRRHQFMTLIVGLVIVSTSVVLVHVAQGLIVTS